jgi:hypothetical protein
VQADIGLTDDVVALYRALGGGWQDAGTESRAPAIEPSPPIAPAALDSVAATPAR